MEESIEKTKSEVERLWNTANPSDKSVKYPWRGVSAPFPILKLEERLKKLRDNQHERGNQADE